MMTSAACAREPSFTCVSKTCVDRLLRRSLDPRVECCPDDHVFRGFPRQVIGRLRHDPVGEVPAGPGLRRVREIGGRGNCRCRIGLRDIALRLHQPNDHRRTILRALEVRGRRIAGWRLQEPREHRRFRHVHLPRGFPEIALCRGLEPVGSGPEIDAVQVDRKDVVLGVFELHRQNDGDLLQMPLERPGLVEEEELCDLLGDRGATLDDPPGPEVRDHRPRHADGIDAGMGVEPLVLRCEDRMAEMGRGGACFQITAELLSAPGEDLAIPVREDDRPAIPAIQKRIDRRQGCIEVPDRDPENHGHGERQARTDPPDAAKDRAHQPPGECGDRNLLPLPPLCLRLLRPCHVTALSSFGSLPR